MTRCDCLTLDLPSRASCCIGLVGGRSADASRSVGLVCAARRTRHRDSGFILVWHQTPCPACGHGWGRPLLAVGRAVSSSSVGTTTGWHFGTPLGVMSLALPEAILGVGLLLAVVMAPPAGKTSPLSADSSRVPTRKPGVWTRPLHEPSAHRHQRTPSAPRSRQRQNARTRAAVESIPFHPIRALEVNAPFAFPQHPI